MASGKTWNRRLALASGAALAAGGVTLALRGPGGAHHRIPDAKTFRRGNVAEPQTLDPTMSSGQPEFEIIGDLIVGLIAHSPDAQLIPGMATRWETSADGLTWTFHLRESQWSDGVPLTSDDFLFSLRRLMDPKLASEYAYLLYFIVNAEAVNAGKAPLTALGVDAPDPRTLRIHLTHPVPYLLRVATHSTMYPVPRHVIH